mgnify:CR=1 FL=1
MKNKQEVFNSEKISPGHHGQECPGNGEFPGIDAAVMNATSIWNAFAIGRSIVTSRPGEPRRSRTSTADNQKLPGKIPGVFC